MSAGKHDLIFFEKRSTPKVVSRGQRFVAPESYGKQTRRRPATEEEEKIIARGDWLRVDQSGNKGGEDGYKKTRMKGREHLVHTLGGPMDHEFEKLRHRGEDSVNTLLHATADGGGSAKGNFDESKVKRDGRGKFARKMSRLDAKYDTSQEVIMKALADPEYGKAYAQAFAEASEKLGIRKNFLDLTDEEGRFVDNYTSRRTFPVFAKLVKKYQ